MKNISKFLIALMILLMPVTIYASAQHSNVMVFYNGGGIEFGEYGAYYDAAHNTVMAPLYAIMDALGAEAEFDSETGTVSIAKDRTVVSMILNNMNASVNENRQVELPAPPIMENETIYIPLEFVATSLRYNYEFRSESMYAVIETKLTYELGVLYSEIKPHLGEPDRVDNSEKGYPWYVYTNDYINYTLIGVENDVAVAYFVSGLSWAMDCGIFSGMKLSACDTLMVMQGASSTREHNRQIYVLNDEVYTVLFDRDENVFAVLAEKSGYEDIHSLNSFGTSSAAMELSDLVNCYRVINNVQTIGVDSRLSSVARMQSNEMADTGEFSHTDSSERDYIQRLKDAGFEEFYAGEVIAEAYENSFILFSDLIMDESYCAMALAKYDAMGCGVAYNENSEAVMYYTQIFFCEKG